MDEMFKTNRDFFVTESDIDPKIPPSSLIAFCRQRKTTGVIRIELIEGGIRQIVVSERTKLTEKERDELRSILGMD